MLSKWKEQGSNPTVGKNFSFCPDSSLVLRYAQLDYANRNEINRDIHLTNTLF